MQNALKAYESRRIWDVQIFNSDKQKVGPNKEPVLQNWFLSKKLGSHSLIRRNFKKLKIVILNHVECTEI